MDATLACERYLRHQRVEGRSPKTLEYNRGALKQFLDHLGKQGHSLTVEDLCDDDLRGFIEWLQDTYPSPYTVAGRTKAVRAWGHWLEKEEYLPRHPFLRVRRVREGEATRTGLTVEQAEKLLRDCDRATLLGTRDFAMFLTLFSTGLRLSELLDLTTADLDRARQLIVVRHGKGGKSRLVPLSRPVERAIDKYLRHPQRPTGERLWLSQHGKPLGKEGAHAIIVRHGKAVGIHAHAHLFRHGCAIQYLRNGGRVEVLRAMLGHSKLEMTLHYARIAGVDLVEAHDTADPIRGLKVRA